MKWWIVLLLIGLSVIAAVVSILSTVLVRKVSPSPTGKSAAERVVTKRQPGLELIEWPFAGAEDESLALDPMPSDSDCPVVLVHFGEELPAHVFDCLDQLAVVGVRKVFFIVDSLSVSRRLEHTALVETVMYTHDESLRQEIQRVHGEDNVFFYSIERFFALEWFMAQTGSAQLFHMEHDNLIYLPLGRLIGMIREQVGSKLAVPRDILHRCVASVFFVGSREALQHLCQFFRTTQFQKIEMFALCDFLVHHPEWCSPLPVVPAEFPTATGLTLSEPVMGCLFDAAALGQWVGGIDVIHSDSDTRGFVNSDTVDYSANELHVLWSLTPRGKRIPVIRWSQKYFLLANLHIHSKQLHLYMSTTYMDRKDIIQGERFRDLAELQLTSTEEMDRPKSAWADAKSAYVDTHHLSYFFERVWPSLTGPVVLITHNSDDCITNEFLPYLNDSKLKKWFAQNCQTDHPKLIPLPIGIANGQYPHGDLEVLQEVMSERRAQRNELYVNLSETHPVRRRLLEYFRQHPSPDVVVQSPGASYRDYLRTLQGFKFVSSPRGNGPDCHRMWEAFYLDTLPVTYDRAFGTQPCIPQHYLPSVDAEQPGWKGMTEADVHWRKRRARGRLYGRMSFWKHLIESTQAEPSFDVVVSGESPVLNQCLRSVLRHVIGVRRLYYVGVKDPEVPGVTVVRSLTSQCQPSSLPGILERVLVVHPGTQFTGWIHFVDGSDRMLWSLRSPSASLYTKFRQADPSFSWSGRGVYPDPVPLFVSELSTMKIPAGLDWYETAEWYYVHAPDRHRFANRPIFSKQTDDLAQHQTSAREGYFQSVVLVQGEGSTKNS